MPGGDFAKDLAKSRSAALTLYEKLQDDSRYFLVSVPETDIVVWGVQGTSTSEMSQKAHALFKHAESNQLYLSLYKYPAAKLDRPDFEIDRDFLVCLRSSLMKPEHEAWIEEIWKRIHD